MSVSDETTTVSDGIILSDAAASKVKSLLEQEGRDDLALRVAVQPGGCSGLRYQLFFDERSLDGAVLKIHDGTSARRPSTECEASPKVTDFTVTFPEPSGPLLGAVALSFFSACRALISG